MAKIAVLVSGGIDSSVALRLLKDQGHTIVAFYLKIWLEDELSYLGNCPWQEDLSYVQAICSQANIPLEVISLQREYWAEVVNYTLNEIKLGRTPNPDILCNQRVKFGAFFSKIDESFDYVATGHYAQVKKLSIDNTGERFVLHTAPDAIKDQTYFLSHLSQKQLSRALFPIGHLLKSEVRALGIAYDLPNQARKDSQGICFLGKLKFDEFIRHYLGNQLGDLIEAETGKKMGTHPGFWYYTIGQRQGLGLAGGPWYVTSKDTQKNVVYISKNYYSEDKSRNELYIQSCNWFIKPDLEITYKIKLRHGAKFNSGTLQKVETSLFCNADQILPLSEEQNLSENDAYKITLANRDQGIAAGQFVVFYQEDKESDRCIGSGIIVDAPIKK